MKIKSTINFILLLVVSTVFLGCACIPPPDPLPIPQDRINEPYRPFTYAIWERLVRDSIEDREHIIDYEVKLFGRIVLERAYSRTTAPTPDGDGILRYLESFTREVISFNDGTTGVARVERARVERDRMGNREVVILRVYFEGENDAERDFFLEFTANSDDPEEFFSLQYARPASLPPLISATGPSLSDERGTIRYGSDNQRVEYDLRYSGGRKPYLMIMLAQDDETIIDARVVRGRRIRERL